MQPPRTRRTSCGYWPLIKEYTEAGTFGPTVRIQPHKVYETLDKNPMKLGWYQLEINIIEGGVFGPFNFETRFTVPKQAWEALIQNGERIEIDISNITAKPAPSQQLVPTYQKTRASNSQRPNKRTRKW